MNKEHQRIQYIKSVWLTFIACIYGELFDAVIQKCSVCWWFFYAAANGRVQHLQARWPP